MRPTGAQGMADGDCAEAIALKVSGTSRAGCRRSQVKTVGALPPSFNRLVQPAEIAELLYVASQSPVVNGSMMHANLGMIER